MDAHEAGAGGAGLTESIIRWDSGGYPTEESLERLREALRSGEIPTAVRAFYAALRENKWPDWCGPERIEVRGEQLDVWAYHTGGWSGNESIIDVLLESWLFWWLLQRYDAGGHWYFRHPKDVAAMREEVG